MSDLSHDVAPWFTDVNYKDANVMLSVLKKLRDATATFPNHRDVFVQPSLHGGRFTYRGTKPHDWITRIECLGHLNWLAERFAMLMNDGRKFYSCIGFATFDAAAKDVLSHGAYPVVFEDFILTRQYGWGKDPQKLGELANGFLRCAKEYGAAITGGETA